MSGSPQDSCWAPHHHYCRHCLPHGLEVPRQSRGLPLHELGLLRLLRHLRELWLLRLLRHLRELRLLLLPPLSIQPLCNCSVRPLGLLWEDWNYVARNRGRLLRLRCHRGRHLRSSIVRDGDSLLRLRCPRNGWPLRPSAIVPALWQCCRVLICNGICPACSFRPVCRSLLLSPNLIGFKAHALGFGLEAHAIGLELFGLQPFGLLSFSELLISHQVPELPIVGVSGLGTDDRPLGAGAEEEEAPRRLLFSSYSNLSCSPLLFLT